MVFSETFFNPEKDEKIKNLKIFWLNLLIGYYNSVAFLEKNDCSVYTIATAFCIPYLYAHKFLENYGRKFKKSFREWNMLINHLEKEKLIKKLPKKEYCRYYRYKKKYCFMTIQTFLNTHPHGIYIITTSEHVATVRDGILYDRFDSKKYHIQYVHKILNK